MRIYRKGLIILGMSLLLMLSACDTSSFKLVNNVVNQEVTADSINIADLEDYIQLAIAKVEKSVIGITCTNTTLLLETQSLGSGVVVKRFDNETNYGYYAVTNRHVIMNDMVPSENIVVYLGYQDLEVSASLVLYKTDLDLALIYFETPVLLEPVTIGDSTLLKRGNFVIALGNPYSYNYYGTATLGIVSFPVRTLEEDVFNSTSTVTNYYIQHDAAINSGNSGGGLFDLNGNLVGINTWKIVGDSEDSFEGMGFSVPSDVVSRAFKTYLEEK